jgi:hypothetical protein|tara:strand:- start:448 stop:762 length:315 start_codon:yes stop_codon:yes gene_type:complete
MPDDLFHVLAKAVESYRAANVRGRNYTIRGYTSQKLIDDFPGYYGRHSDGKVLFVGESANEILEKYLQSLGYERNSKVWYRLARDVIELAEGGYGLDEETEVGE